jgi:hypothetical protein
MAQITIEAAQVIEELIAMAKQFRDEAELAVQRERAGATANDDQGTAQALQVSAGSGGSRD